MKNDLTKPCAGCPFRKDGSGVHLGHDRIVELARITAKGGAFACHKTTDKDLDEDEHDEDAQLCAGSLAFALNSGDRIAEMVVHIRMHGDASKIARLEESRERVYRTTDEWLARGCV